MTRYSSNKALALELFNPIKYNFQVGIFQKWRWKIDILEYTPLYKCLFLLAVVFISINTSIAQWINTDGLEGGDIRIVHEHNSHLFVGSRSGIYRSDDLGQTWVQKNTGLPIDVMITCFESQGTTLYVGFEKVNSGGVYKSDDNGDNWSEYLPFEMRVRSFEVNGTDAYVGGFAYSIPSLGIDIGTLLYSSDNGKNWSNIHDPQMNAVFHIIQDQGTLYASTQGKFYISPDNGNSWVDSTPPDVGNEISEIFLFDNKIWLPTQGRGLYSSADGIVWSSMNSGFDSRLFIYDLFEKDNVLYASSGSGAAYTSIDLGSTWVATSTLIPTSDVFTIYTNGTTILVTGRSLGVFTSSDNGGSWQSSNDGLSAATIYELVSDGVNVYASGGPALFGFTPISNGPWTMQQHGTTPNEFVRDMVYFNGAIYMSTGKIYRTTDLGSTWVEVSQQIEAISGSSSANIINVFDNLLYATGRDGMYVSSNGINWTAHTDGFQGVSPNDMDDLGDNIFIAGNGVYIFSKSNKSLTEVSRDDLGAVANERIIETGDGMILVSGGQFLYISEDDGSTWKEVSPKLPNTSTGQNMVTIKDVKISNDKILLGVSREVLGESIGLYVSNDKGGSWEIYNQSLESKKVNVLEIFDDKIYVGTDGGGVWYRNLDELVPGPILEQDSLALVAFYNATNNLEVGEADFLMDNGWLTEPMANWVGVETGIDPHRVKSLNLSSNALNGQIPNELGDLSGLEELSLITGDELGTIPETIGNLHQLKTLFLGGNMEGTIPESIGNLTNLTDLSLALNFFTGSIPSSIGNLKKLKHLSLNQNELTGTIPIEIENLKDLLTIALQDNQLEGEIPQAFARLKLVNSISLDLNNFTAIPDFSSLGEVQLPEYNGIQAITFFSNRIPFEDIEANLDLFDIASFNTLLYVPQKALSPDQDLLVNVGESISLSAITASENNSYQWKKNGENLTGETSMTLEIANTSSLDVGVYHCVITNSVITDLTLRTGTTNLVLTSNISGTVLNPDGSPVLEAKAYLLKVNATLEFDTTQIVDVTDGNMIFDDVAHGEYKIVAQALKDEQIDATLLATYYGDIVFWEIATTIELSDDISNLEINLQSAPDPANLVGNNSISGNIEILNPGGRFAQITSGIPVGLAAVNDPSVLIASTLSDSEGAFDFENLSDGSYNLNIQYVGFPMDSTSIRITVSPEYPDVELKAIIDSETGKIAVENLTVTSILKPDTDVISLFPNPVKDRLFISSRHNLITSKLVISDLTGRSLIQHEIRNVELEDGVSLEHLRNGVYIVTITGPEFKEKLTEKIIVR